jgi:hypothetical protein
MSEKSLLNTNTESVFDEAQNHDESRLEHSAALHYNARFLFVFIPGQSEQLCL